MVLTSPEGNTYSAQVGINSEDPIFLGHFPGQPILPGVCTLAILKDCICRATQKSMIFCEVVQCKFVGMVDPSASGILSFDFTLAGAEGKQTVNATISEGERVVMKIKAVMAEVF